MRAARYVALSDTIALSGGLLYNQPVRKTFN
jgi:hypothetical protein